MLSRRTALSSKLAAAVAAPRAQAEAVTILRVQRRVIEVNGKSTSRLSISQPDGRQGMMTTAGQQFRTRVENQLDVPTLIHWHGLTPPRQQNGVPGISSPPIAPGASADYDFPLGFGAASDAFAWRHVSGGRDRRRAVSGSAA